MTKEQKMRQVFTLFCKTLGVYEYRDEDGQRAGFKLSRSPLQRQFQIVEVVPGVGERCPFRETYRTPEQLTTTMHFAIDAIELRRAVLATI